MEIDDEDVVIRGTDLQKYLNAAGYSEFEVSEPKNVEDPSLPKNITKEPKCPWKMYRPTQNYTKDFSLCLTIIKNIIESRLMFKEDTLFIKEFIPPDQTEYPLFLSKRNGFIIFILCIFCIFLNIVFPKYCDEWSIVGILAMWLGYVFMEILYSWNQNRTINKTVLKTIRSMEKSSLLIQKATKFIHECNNLHGVYNGYNDTHAVKNSSNFVYLLMPELKILLFTVMQDIINNLVFNISQVRTFFPLKDSISKAVYLYLTDCKVDLEDSSLENLNKAKYTYFLLQSEFMKQIALCFCPVLWTPKSSSQMNLLIETIRKIGEVYSNIYNVLSEEYNVYSLFKNNKVESNEQPNESTITNPDLKLKMYNVRQLLQNMMVHVRFMEDTVEDSSKFCVDDINKTLNVLMKDINVFNELISTLQIYILKTNDGVKKDKIVLENKTAEVTDHVDAENETVNVVSKDELFFGVSEELAEEVDNKCYDEEIFDKSNNQNLISELKVALKNKQDEWKERELKLLEKHPQLDVVSNCSDEEDDNNEKKNQYISKVRKVALDLPPSENFSMQLPSQNFANEIAMVACKWNAAIESFGDNSDSDTSINSSGS